MWIQVVLFFYLFLQVQSDTYFSFYFILKVWFNTTCVFSRSWKYKTGVFLLLEDICGQPAQMNKIKHPKQNLYEA